jgi:ATP-binding cassette subfamily A (ABC1) protein 3
MVNEYLEHENHSDILSIDSINIRYTGSPNLTIDSLSLHVECGERIGFLGINSAGKSTIFKAIISSENIIEQGEIKVNGHSTASELWSVMNSGMIGYAPQEGGMIDCLSVHGILQRFTSIRETTLSSVCDDLISLVERNTKETTDIIVPREYASYSIQSLSGGNKRRLSVALANIGQPPLLLLDEPTTGLLIFIAPYID